MDYNDTRIYSKQIKDSIDQHKTSKSKRQWGENCGQTLKNGNSQLFGAHCIHTIDNAILMTSDRHGQWYERIMQWDRSQMAGLEATYLSVKWSQVATRARETHISAFLTIEQSVSSRYAVCNNLMSRNRGEREKTNGDSSAFILERMVFMHLPAPRIVQIAKSNCKESNKFKWWRRIGGCNRREGWVREREPERVWRDRREKNSLGRASISKFSILASTMQFSTRGS